MAKQTPEGKVKDKIINLVKGIDNSFYFMPSQNGYGQVGIPDIFFLFKRIPFWIETKSNPSHQPTTLQAQQLEKIHNAGTPAWVIDNSNVEVFVAMIKTIKDKTPAQAYKIAMKFEKDNPEILRWNKKLAPLTLSDVEIVGL